MIIFNKLGNYFVVSADSQTFLGFEMTANFRDTSPLRISKKDVSAPLRSTILLFPSVMYILIVLIVFLLIGLMYVTLLGSRVKLYDGRNTLVEKTVNNIRFFTIN